MSNKTHLGPELEKQVLAELEPVIAKFAKLARSTPESVKSSVAYLWADAERQARVDWDNYLSANEIGPYGGR